MARASNANNFFFLPHSTEGTEKIRAIHTMVKARNMMRRCMLMSFWFVFNWLMFVLEIWLTTVRLQTTSDLLYISDAFYFSIIGFNDDCNYAIMSNIKRDIDQRWWWWWTLFFPFCFSLSFFPIDMLLPPMFNGKARFQDGHRSSHLLLSLIIFFDYRSIVYMPLASSSLVAFLNRIHICEHGLSNELRWTGYLVEKCGCCQW